MLMQEGRGTTPLKNATLNAARGLGRGGRSGLTRVCGEMSPPPACHRQPPRALGSLSLLLLDLRALPSRRGSRKPCSLAPPRVVPSSCQVWGVNLSRNTAHPCTQNQFVCPLTAQRLGGGGGLIAEWCPTLVIPRTVTHQAPLSMGFPRQEYWSGLPCPPPGDLPDPEIEPRSPAFAGGFFSAGPPGKLVRTIPGFAEWGLSRLHHPSQPLLPVRPASCRAACAWLLAKQTPSWRDQQRPSDLRLPGFQSVS